MIEHVATSGGPPANATAHPAPDEIGRLMACISDLLGAFGLRAIESGSDPALIVSSLVDSLMGTLDLDFVYARCDDGIGGPPVRSLRFDGGKHLQADDAAFGRALDGLLAGLPSAACRRVPHPIRSGHVCVLSVPLGAEGSNDLLVAASSRPEFPTQSDRLLLSVAATQATIGLHEGRRMALRALELMAANEALKREIAERRRVEEALRLSEMYLAEAQRLSQTGSFGWDPVSGTMHWSAETFQLTGLPPAVQPTGEHVLQRVHPEDLAQYQEAFSRAKRSSESLDFEHRLLMDDGTVRHVHVRARPLRQASGRIEFVGALTDVTHRRRAEAERLKLEVRLARAEKLEAIGTLAGGIAHDFNNILAAIFGYTELAQKKSREGRPIADDLAQVMQAGRRGKRLVESILAFSRSGGGRRGPVHVQSVVQETLALLAASLPEGVRLEQNLQAGDAAVLGDATQFHQVTMNLCTNAVQSMAGGGRLSVVLDCIDSPQPRSLSHGSLQPGGYVRLAVSDTGSGIEAGELKRIFDPFFTTKGVHKGTGLGLSLVHGIVAESRGAIDVATVTGVGTTFTVWLPCSGETALPPDDERPELPLGTGESVMVVDDENALVKLAEETVARLGYEVAGFDSSVAALEAFCADPQRYQLVLTDQTMPDLTGTELAHQIRQLRPDVPILLMSGYKGPPLSALARAAGVREILHKPLVSREIAEALARALA